MTLNFSCFSLPCRWSAFFRGLVSWTQHLSRRPQLKTQNWFSCFRRRKIVWIEFSRSLLAHRFTSLRIRSRCSLFLIRSGRETLKNLYYAITFGGLLICFDNCSFLPVSRISILRNDLIKTSVQNPSALKWTVANTVSFAFHKTRTLSSSLIYTDFIPCFIERKLIKLARFKTKNSFESAKWLYSSNFLSCLHHPFKHSSWGQH